MPEPAMSDPALLTDRAALARNRARALAGGFDPFLHAAVADEIEERLTEVNRTFTSPAVVSGFSGWWGARLAGARSVADDDRLDLAEGAHDLIVHALCLHWANDPVGQLVQCRRALRPDGLLLCAALGGRTLSELRSALAEAEVRLTGGLSPRVLPMGEIRDLGGLLQRAGLALPVADASPLRVTYPGLTALVRDLRAMGEGNALAARARRTPRALFPTAAEIYAEAFAAGGGRIAATFETVFLTGWAPAPGQPRPLRPGSASMRLADALADARKDGDGDDPGDG
jgi:SAM-dependent methyltransferase